MDSSLKITLKLKHQFKYGLCQKPVLAPVFHDNSVMSIFFGWLIILHRIWCHFSMWYKWKQQIWLLKNTRYWMRWIGVRRERTQAQNTQPVFFSDQRLFLPLLLCNYIFPTSKQHLYYSGWKWQDTTCLLLSSEIVFYYGTVIFSFSHPVHYWISEEE